VSDGIIRVTATDVETGATDEQMLKPGSYLVICVEPAYVAHEQVHANGTRVVTVKKRIAA
jgi:hypothetical protein